MRQTGWKSNIRCYTTELSPVLQEITAGCSVQQSISGEAIWNCHWVEGEQFNLLAASHPVSCRSKFKIMGDKNVLKLDNGIDCAIL